MKPFMDEHFLLTSGTARRLYHHYAHNMPIFDYHCHLSPKEIAENRRFRNITEIWLGGDHYKWRAMRAHGIAEQLITGDADDKAKFRAWAKTVPYCIGNPLYHWTHLELQRYFDYHDVLGEHNWEHAWEHCNQVIASEAFTVQRLITGSGVKVICTTDDPVDALEHHLQLQQNAAFDVKVLPTFRPDKAIEVGRATFAGYVASMEQACGRQLTELDAFLEAIEERAKYFHEAGCRISDHGIESIPFSPCHKKEAAEIYRKALAGDCPSVEEEAKYKTYVLLSLGRLYGKLGWTMQLHLGALRNNNTRMFNALGPDAGYDSIGDYQLARGLTRYLDALDQAELLPRTILYNLNPADNEVIATMIGNYQTGGIRGKIQFGSGWWFNDTKDGMLAQMRSLANQGLLSNFVGMLTDSRSFLSYTRHEYFRRVLCNLIGDWVEQGEYPADETMLGAIVQDICYRNAERYFGIQVEAAAAH